MSRELLPQLLEWLAEADQIAREGFRSREFELKPDGSIVTATDRRVEEFFRERLPSLVPAAIWGEEFGFEEPNEHGLWLIDPIDGTSNFAMGLPEWGITIGLLQGSDMTAGVISLPELGWTFDGAIGDGARFNGEALPRIKPGPIQAHELIGHGDGKLGSDPAWPGKMRHMGAFVMEMAGFLRGNLRAMTTSRVKLYDAAGGIVMARELGAELTHLDGTKFNESEWGNGKSVRPFAFLPPQSGLPITRE